MSRPHILVAFALPDESRDFRRALATADAGDIRVEHFGVGPAMAGERIRQWLAADAPDLFICAGYAGGLDPRLATGDIVVAENLSSSEVIAELRSRGNVEGQGVGGRRSAAAHFFTPEAIALTEQRPPAFGPVVSRALPVETVADKAAVFRETGALVVDMESETIAAACHAVAVPLLVVRTISDPASEALPVPFEKWFDLARQGPRVMGLLKYLSSHPGQILPFVRFVRGLTPARQSLAAFLLRLLEGDRKG